MTTTSKWIIGIVAGVAVLAVVAIAFIVITIGSAVSFEEETEEIVTGEGEGQIALVKVEDAIIDGEETIRQLKKFSKRSSVKAIVVYVNSPGGGVVPSHEIYQQVKEISSKKKLPVVISMGSVAASGGYYIACGGSRIMANPGTITGSIGVISQFANIQALLQKIGIETQTIKSGKFKDIGSPTRKMSDEEIATLQSTINDVYSQFVDVVAENRKLAKDSVLKLADGRIYSGAQAYQLGLVDTLGTLHDAIMLAAKLGKIKGEPRILKEQKRVSLFEEIMGTETAGTIEDLRVRFNQLTPLEYRMSF